MQETRSGFHVTRENFLIIDSMTKKSKKLKLKRFFFKYNKKIICILFYFKKQQKRKIFSLHVQLKVKKPMYVIIVKIV